MPPSPWKVPYGEAGCIVPPAAADGTKYFRLIRLISDTTIMMKTFVVDSAANPRYFALSYTWGANKSRTTHKVDVVVLGPNDDWADPKLPRDRKYTHEVGVTASLAATLPELRRLQSQNMLTAGAGLGGNDKDMWFWIDGICINQDDDNDKAIQIPYMRDIYDGVTGRNSSAKQNAATLIWLDSDADYYAAALRLINTRDASIDGQHATLTSLYSNRYWGRVWIIQEACVSSPHHTYLISRAGEPVLWSKFASFTRGLHARIPASTGTRGDKDALEASLAPVERLVAMRSLFQNCTKHTKPNAFLPLGRILNTLRANLPNCDMSRDRVYALAGLASEGSHPAKLHAELGTYLGPKRASDCDIYCRAIRVLWADWMHIQSPVPEDDADAMMRRIKKTATLGANREHDPWKSGLPVPIGTMHNKCDGIKGCNTYGALLEFAQAFGNAQ